jgi:phage major head subunit gpT-like protein
MQGFVHSTGFAPELLYPGLADIWGSSYKQMPKKYERFFTVKNSEKRFEKEQGMTGFSLATVKDEGDSVEFARLNQGYQKEYLHTTFGLGAIVTREMVEDDQYDYIRQIPRLLAEAMVRTEEVMATGVLNNGFDATVTGADGQPLFAAAHPNAGSSGGTQRNTPATPADLTQTSLEAAIIAVRDFRDDNGQRALFEPRKLVVSINDSFNAQKILQTEYKVGSSDNDVNIISMMNLELTITNYLTDPDAWFLITDVTNGLTFYRRRAATIERDNDVSTQNLAVITTQRFDVGFTDWRTAFGNPGA